MLRLIMFIYPENPPTNKLATVHRDVEHIQPLTKSDLQTFYRSYFHPSSSTRAKASVHLIAQGGGSSNISAAAGSSSENLKKLTSALSQALTQLGGDSSSTAAVDDTALSQQLSKLDLSSGTSLDPKKVMGALTSYLRNSAGLAEERVKELVEQGEGLLGQILPALNLTSAASSEETVSKEGPSADVPVANGHGVSNGGDGEGEEKKQAILIKDVRAWKAGLQASRGPRAVRDLSEFEDLGAKL